jgi:hypothetical protein
MNNPTPAGPSRGATASLAEIVAEIINGYSAAGQDSTGQEMVQVRKAKMDQLQRALADLYPDARDHNRTVINALLRR